MYFDYESYRAYCYENPIFGLSIFSFAFLMCIVSIVIQGVRKKLVLKDMAIYTLFALGYALVISIALGQLMHGGIYLQYEKESDAIELCGEITDIRGLELFSFPIVEGGYKHEEKNGYEFIINGIKCKAVLKGSLNTGDYVTVKYLPKSGYILYISEIDRNATHIK